jgi:hypothetical protein
MAMHGLLRGEDRNHSTKQSSKGHQDLVHFTQ